jgi:thiosulfate dehydrogenase [quinone] large subunit
MKDHKATAYALLRVTLGIVFLFYGLGKFMLGFGNFAGGMQQRFAGKLPMALVVPFAYSLPFIEVLIGVFLIVGLFNSIALVLSGLLLIALTFGMVILGDTPTVANNLLYVLINFVLLYLAERNIYSVDRIKPRKLQHYRS